MASRNKNYLQNIHDPNLYSYHRAPHQGNLAPLNTVDSFVDDARMTEPHAILDRQERPVTNRPMRNPSLLEISNDPEIEAQLQNATMLKRSNDIRNLRGSTQRVMQYQPELLSGQYQVPSHKIDTPGFDWTLPLEIGATGGLAALGYGGMAASNAYRNNRSIKAAINQGLVVKDPEGNFFLQDGKPITKQEAIDIGNPKKRNLALRAGQGALHHASLGKIDKAKPLPQTTIAHEADVARSEKPKESMFTEGNKPKVGYDPKVGFGFDRNTDRFIDIKVRNYIQSGGKDVSGYVQSLQQQFGDMDPKVRAKQAVQALKNVPVEDILTSLVSRPDGTPKINSVTKRPYTLEDVDLLRGALEKHYKGTSITLPTDPLIDEGPGKAKGKGTDTKLGSNLGNLSKQDLTNALKGAKGATDKLRSFVNKNPGSAKGGAILSLLGLLGSHKDNAWDFSDLLNEDAWAGADVGGAFADAGDAMIGGHENYNLDTMLGGLNTNLPGEIARGAKDMAQGLIGNPFVAAAQGMGGRQLSPEEERAMALNSRMPAPTSTGHGTPMAR